MIFIDNVDVYGWDAAIRGMRNPMNSWDKSDTEHNVEFNLDIEGNPILSSATYITNIGPNDLKLMKNLSNAGSDHGKYLRMINVTMDITAPLYWWKEFDTYKIGTVSNSCSTMHKIHAKEFTINDFSVEHLNSGYRYLFENYIIEPLNEARNNFINNKDKEDWWQMIQLLPSSYNQRRTIQCNYQVLKSIYHARKDHKLDEWHVFCELCEKLPYFGDLCISDNS